MINTFEALNDILGQQVLYQPSKTSMCTHIELVCTHIRVTTLKHHTLEVPNANLHQKKEGPTHLNKRIHSKEYHCLHKKITHTIHIQVQIHKEEVGLCINIIKSKGPIVVTKFDATSRCLKYYYLNSTLNSILTESLCLPSWIKNVIIREIIEIERELKFELKKVQHA